MPTSDEIARIDYGPFPNDYRELVAAHLGRMLRDPESARVTYIKGPGRIWRRASIVGAEFSGWGICLEINAKNAYGGYVGATQYAAVIREGRVIQFVGSSNTRETIERGMAEAMCSWIS